MSIRILGLGNDLLADDRLGLVAASALGRRFGDRVEAVCSFTSGFDLLDDLVGASRLLVLDTLATGVAPPGTVYEVTEDDVVGPGGGSPHYVGLFEALRLGRSVGLAMPFEVVILAVEPEDILTVGGEMSHAVAGAVEPLLERAGAIVLGWIAADAAAASSGVCTSHAQPH
jgi:hydrogenase maturation protease